MIGTIISAVVIGAIIGGLARLVMPGRQNISIPMTILLGALGALIGSWLLGLLFNYNNANGGINWIGILGGVVLAAVFITAYLSMTGRKNRV